MRRSSARKEALPSATCGVAGHPFATAPRNRQGAVTPLPCALLSDTETPPASRCRPQLTLADQGSGRSADSCGQPLFRRRCRRRQRRGPARWRRDCAAAERPHHRNTRANPLGPGTWTRVQGYAGRLHAAAVPRFFRVARLCGHRARGGAYVSSPAGSLLRCRTRPENEGATQEGPTFRCAWRFLKTSGSVIWKRFSPKWYFSVPERLLSCTALKCPLCFRWDRLQLCPGQVFCAHAP